MGLPRLRFVSSAGILGTLALLLAACSQTSPPPSTGSFRAASSSAFATGGDDSVSVAVGDFNGDGKPDLAVANLVSGNVSVLLGNGNGGFTAAPGSPLGPIDFPRSVAVGDFNGDGKLDLAVVSDSVGGPVSVYLGDGNGGFTAAPDSPFAVGINPLSVVVGDFNSDGNLDLAVGNSVDHNVTLLLGNGSGDFSAAPGSPFATGNGPWSLAAGDINGDGKLDLVVGGAVSGTISVLLGNGNGGFTLPASFTTGSSNSPQVVAIGDFNNDGKPDIAVASLNDNDVSVLLGFGGGGFTPAPGSPFAAGNGPNSVAVGDFNGDGNLDLAIADANGAGAVTVLLGNGGGGFTPAPGSPFAAGSSACCVAVGDFNGDRKLDLAVPGGINAGFVSVLLGQ